MEFSSADVGQVYEHEMLSIRGHAELAHYEGRLKVVLGEASFPLAMDMLTEAAVVGHLSDDACRALQREYVFPNQNVVEAQKEILGVLEHDGYLAPGSDGYAFVSKLLRDWWKARTASASLRSWSEESRPCLTDPSNTIRRFSLKRNS